LPQWLHRLRLKGSGVVLMRMALEFSKKGAAKYISHLDLQRAFSRALRRSGLPVSLSAGFNPHYVLSFASALSLGVESECECVEMALTEPVAAEDFLLRIARALPPGLTARRAVRLREDAPRLMAALNEAAYTALIETPDLDSVRQAVYAIMKSDEVIGIKKKDNKSINMRPMIKELKAGEHNIAMRLAAAQTGTLRPDMVLQAISEKSAPFTYRLLRTALYAHVDGQPQDLLTAFMM